MAYLPFTTQYTWSGKTLELSSCCSQAQACIIGQSQAGWKNPRRKSLFKIAWWGRFSGRYDLLLSAGCSGLLMIAKIDIWLPFTEHSSDVRRRKSERFWILQSVFAPSVRMILGTNSTTSPWKNYTSIHHTKQFKQFYRMFLWFRVFSVPRPLCRGCMHNRLKSSCPSRPKAKRLRATKCAQTHVRSVFLMRNPYR